MVMDESKVYSVCSNNSNSDNVNDDFRTLDINERNINSDLKRNSTPCDNGQNRSSEHSHTAFPVNLKEVFELTNPNSDVNQTLIRQSDNVDSSVTNYQLSQMSPIKCDEQKQSQWTESLQKSQNMDDNMREGPTSVCDPFLIKPLSYKERLSMTNAAWSHAFRDSNSEDDKLCAEVLTTLSSNDLRTSFRTITRLPLSTENGDNIIEDHRPWSESLNESIAPKDAVIVTDVSFHDFTLSRIQNSLEIQENQESEKDDDNKLNKSWRSSEHPPKQWYSSLEQSTIKQTVSENNKKTVIEQPVKKDASCQVEDFSSSSDISDRHILYEKQSNIANNTTSAHDESQNLANNPIKPELYTEERNLRVQLGNKAYVSQSQSGIHTCSQCGKVFSDNRSLQRHLMVHSGLRTYRCHECNKSFMLRGDLTRHVRIHSGEKPYACEICGRRFTLKGNLMQHFRTHSPEKQYACTLCSKNYAQKDSLHRHIRAHFGDKPFQCHHCGKRFTLKGDLSRHTLIHSGVKPHMCKYCGRNFSLKGNLMQHIRIHSKSKTDFNPAFLQNEERLIQDLSYSHVQKKQLLQNNLSPVFKLPLEIKESTENLPIPVEDENTLISFSPTNGSTNHQLQTTTGLAFCSACCRTFPSPESLQKHVQLVHEQSTRLANNRYLCNVCEKEFSLKGDLTRHLNSHNGIKPYNCDQCSKTFTLKSNLRQHLTTHTNTKNFSCPLCSKLFGNRRNLSLHLKRHEQASANFTCTKCGRSFLAKSDHFFHQCSKDSSSESTDQVPLNCSLSGTSMYPSPTSPPPSPTVTINHYSIASESQLDLSPSAENNPESFDVSMSLKNSVIKKELSLQQNCSEKEVKSSQPENLSQNNHSNDAFFNPFYRHLYFATTSNQMAMPNLRGLLHPPNEISPDIKMAKAN